MIQGTYWLSYFSLRCIWLTVPPNSSSDWHLLWPLGVHLSFNTSSSQFGLVYLTDDLWACEGCWFWETCALDISTYPFSFPFLFNFQNSVDILSGRMMPRKELWGAKQEATVPPFCALYLWNSSQRFYLFLPSEERVVSINGGGMRSVCHTKEDSC